MEIRGIEVECLDKKIEIPRLWMCSPAEDDVLNWRYGFADFEPNRNAGKKRILTLAESFDIVGSSFLSPMKTEACANMLMPMIICSRIMDPIFGNVGYKIEDRKITVYKNYCPLDKVYEIKPNIEPEEQGLECEKETFDIERLFRKYDPQKCTLKELDKANPELIEYLFEKEYEGIPKILVDSVRVNLTHRVTSATGMHPLYLRLLYKHPHNEENLLKKEFVTDKTHLEFALEGIVKPRITSYWFTRDLE